MKKKLVASLAAAMVLGVAGTSFAAANPFTDVPAKHWAYDSVMKLSQAGIVDGYGDGTYKGDKLISRYEMAQMVAKAMARSDKADAAQKAQIDKLAAEFAEELNVLGVRVSALEKKVGSVKVTGDARIRVVSNRETAKAAINTAPINDTKTQERLRLNFAADVNKDTSFYGRVMIGHTEFGSTETVRVSDAAFTTKNVFNTDATFTAGRFSQSLLSTGYLLGTTGFADGAKATFGNKLKVTAGFANFATATGKADASLAYDSNAAANGNTIPHVVITGANAGAIEDAFFATATYDTSKVTKLYAGYLTERSGAYKAADPAVAHVNGGTAASGSDYDLIGLGFTTKLAKDWAFAADYAQNTNKNIRIATGTDESPVFYVTKLNYKGADAKVQGTWGAGIEYFKFDKGSIPTVTDFSTASMIGLVGATTGNYKAFALTTSYTLAKNVVFEGFQTFNSKTSIAGGPSADTANYSRIQVNYMF